MHHFFTLLRYHASTSFGPICSPSPEGRVYNVANGTCFTPKSNVGETAGPPTVVLVYDKKELGSLVIMIKAKCRLNFSTGVFINFIFQRINLKSIYILYSKE
jgi:hypothetical protein